MKTRLMDAITALSLIGLAVSLFIMIGTAGAIECDTITVKDGVIRCSICMGVLILSTIGLTKMEKAETESEFDDL